MVGPAASQCPHTPPADRNIMEGTGSERASTTWSSRYGGSIEVALWWASNALTYITSLAKGLNLPGLALGVLLQWGFSLDGGSRWGFSGEDIAGRKSILRDARPTLPV